MTQAQDLSRPFDLVAELTHRCPLACPYCSNPLALEPREAELDVATWARVFGEAAALGVRRVHLSGGEPGARRDLVDIAASAREAGLGTNLMTSGYGITTRTLRDLWEAGLERVQVSIQDADAVSSDRIAGQRGAFQRQHGLAAEAVRIGLPLTVNTVVHRANIERIGDMVDMALGLKAVRIGLTPVRARGWAQKNNASLMPSPAQIERAIAQAEELRQRYNGHLVIEPMVADDCARHPRACDGGGRHSLHITPSGRVLPCPDAETVPGLEFWSVCDRPLGEIWAASPAFNVFRSTGECCCRTRMLTGDARACELPTVAAVRQEIIYEYRRASPEASPSGANAFKSA